MKQRIVTNIKSKGDAWDYLFTQEVATVRRLFFEKGMTAREVCKVMGVGQFYEEDPNSFNKAFHRKLGPKGAGHGGARPNSGNKKGVRFCPICKTKLDECEHKGTMTASVKYEQGQLQGVWPVVHTEKENLSDEEIVERAKGQMLLQYPGMDEALPKCEWKVIKKR
jgi:hypothetical protein